jgi:hypothetical protein
MKVPGLALQSRPETVGRVKGLLVTARSPLAFISTLLGCCSPHIRVAAIKHWKRLEKQYGNWTRAFCPRQECNVRRGTQLVEALQELENDSTNSQLKKAFATHRQETEGETSAGHSNFIVEQHKAATALPEDPSSLELAAGLIEALSMNASLFCQVSNSIEMKARAEGISFAAARDQILAAARAQPPPDGKLLRWFQSAVYDHPYRRNEHNHKRHTH